MRIISSLIIFITFLLVLTSTAYPQDRQQMIGRVFEIKYKQASELEKVVTSLLTPGGKLTASDSMKTITVRDFPENVAVIGEAITRLDVPSVVTLYKESFELQLNVIYGTMSALPENETGGIPKHLVPVIDQLRSTLKYKNYHHAFTALNRLVDESDIQGIGVLNSNIPDAPSSYRYNIKNARIEKTSDNIARVSIRQFQFGMPTQNSYKSIHIETPLNLNVGETVVVGMANISGVDNAVIIIVTVKKLKE